ncbi:MAG: arginine repressor [Candidatus Latescibacteria bacterium]|nr:arginine repressor [Candidatus Latescibacterota bacterium]
MSEKKRRQAAIQKILTDSIGSSQEKIKTDLEHMGIVASQSTLSRDLREMGAVKIPVEDGGTVYRLGGQYKLDEIGNAIKAFSIRNETVGNFLVIRTAPGNAPSLCAVLDRQNWQEIVGTIAGDDTILVIARSENDIKTVVKNLNRSIGKDIQ